MTKSIIAPTIRDNEHRQNNKEEYRSLALLLVVGAGLALLVALLIAQDLWFFAFALVLLVPGALLLNRYPFVGIMLWLLLMPFLPTNNVSPYVLWIVHRSLMPMALIIALLSRALRLQKHLPVRLGRAELAMVIYLAIAVASILLTQSSPFVYLTELYDKTFVPFVAYWLIRFCSPREQDLKRLAVVMLIVCLAQIAIGFWAKYAPSTLPQLWAISRMGTRMSGTFGNPNMFAHLLLLLMAFLFHYAMNHKSKIVQVSFVLVFGIGLLCVFLTFTRACWLAAVLVLLGLGYLYPKTTLPLVLAAVSIIIVLSASVFAAEASFAIQRLNTEDTIDSRLVLQHAGEQMFLAKPFLGWGYASYELYDWTFMERVGNSAPTKWDVQKGSSHNTYLTILAEMGAIGIFFYFFPAFWWLVRTIKTMPYLPRQGFWSWRLLIVIWLSVIAYLSIGAVIDMRFSWFSLGAFWLTLGLVANMIQSYLSPSHSEALERSLA